MELKQQENSWMILFYFVICAVFDTGICFDFREKAFLDDSVPDFGECLEIAECGKDLSWTEIQRMDCVNDQIFRGPLAEKENDKVVVHDVHVGWGNSIQGLLSAGSIAATLGRRVQVSFPAFERTFLPPHDTSELWPPLPKPTQRVDHVSISAYQRSDEKGYRRWVS